MSTYVTDAEAFQALYYNQIAKRHEGWAVYEPEAGNCRVTINTGQLGTGTNTLTMQPGDVVLGGDDMSLSAQTINVPQADTAPRKDVVAVDGGGTVIRIAGDPESKQPAGRDLTESERPAPPDLSNTDAVPLAIVCVPAGRADITTDDLIDARPPAIERGGAPGDVTEYGAVGDGVEDDTQAVIDALNDGNGEVFFPQGTYVLNQPLTIATGQKLVGAGRGNTTLQFQGVSGIVTNGRTDSWSVEGLRIVDASSAQDTIGIHAEGYSSSWSLSDLQINGFGGAGVSHSGLFWSVERVKLNGNGENTTGPSATMHCRGDITATVGEYEQVYAETGGTYAFFVQGARGIHLKNCVAEYHSKAFRAENSSSVFVNGFWAEQIGTTPQSESYDSNVVWEAERADPPARTWSGVGWDRRYDVNRTRLDLEYRDITAGRNLVVGGSGTFGGEVQLNGGATAPEPTADDEVANKSYVDTNEGSTEITHHIDDYGADPTGATASDAALDSMIADATPGDVLSLAHGTYRFDQYHDCPIPVTFDGTGGEIIATAYNGDKATFDQNSLFDTEEAVLSFVGELTTTTTTTTSSQRETDSRIAVTDATGFSEGDDLLIRPAGAAILSRSYRPTRTRIQAIDGTDLYLTNALKYSYDAGAEVTRVDPVAGGEFRNLTFEGGDPGNCLSSRYSRNITYQNCSVDGYLQHAMQVWDDLNAKFIDCEVVNPLYRGGSHGEALRVVGSSDVTMVRPMVKDARRCIDIRSGCKTLRIHDPNLRGATLHGFSFHNASGDHVYGSVEIFGGQIAGRSIDDPTLSAAEAHTGYGVSTSSNASVVRLIGVTVESRRNALAGDGNNIIADNCTFRSTYQTSTLYPTVHLTGTNARLTDCTIETYGARGTGLRVEGDDIDVEGLRVESGFTAHGQWTEHPIDIVNAGSVSIDVQNVDWASGTTVGVSIGTVDELTLSGDFAGPTGTEVTSIVGDGGTISNLVLDDIRSAAKIDISGAGSITELWLGMVDAPSIAYGTPGTVRSAYGL